MFRHLWYCLGSSFRACIVRLHVLRLWACLDELTKTSTGYHRDVHYSRLLYAFIMLMLLPLLLLQARPFPKASSFLTSQPECPVPPAPYSGSL
jgi:hypothetical protein